MRHRADYLFRNLTQIDRRRDIEHDRIETSDTEELFDKPVHPCDLFSERGHLTVAFETVQPGRDYSQRRPQLMRRIGG